jgi:hypothetical protein
VPPGQGPAGEVLASAQKQGLPLFSVMDQLIWGTHPVQKLFTDAISATWPFLGIVVVAGEMVTVTLLTLYPLPPPQPPTKISRKASDPTNGTRRVS